ncbi:hypothetical protein [Jannaschia marina]|uniref:hypothetical protein n=1 Tax=Jannaschia marina TaxID=2741674 RepID=UPI0015CDE8D3|nr:hypothetical protein [Jannaschia marina]
MLQHSEAARQAHRLYDMIGDRAEALSAKRAREEQDAGRVTEAENWEMIRRLIRSKRGPNES